MQILLEITLPVFGAIFIGWLACRLGAFGRDASELLNRFVYYISFPALLFVVIARTPVERIFYWPFLLAWGGGQAIIYALTVAVSLALWRERAVDVAVRSMNTTCASTAFLGVPLAVAAFGQEAALPAIMATTVIVVVYISLTILVIEAVGNSHRSATQALRTVGISLAKNPLMMSVVAGALVAAFTSLPKPIERLSELLGAAAIPASLVAIGAFLAGQSIRATWAGISVATAIKLAAHPLATWALVEWVFDVEPVWAKTAILLAALPPATTCFVIAQRYNVLVTETSGTIWISTIVSVASVSAILFWLGV